MSKYVDYQYVNMISNRLEKFQWIRGSHLAVARCPICGDSKKKSNKRRFHVIEYDDRYHCHCKNCSYSQSFGSFLQTFDPFMYKDYRLECFKESGNYKPSIDKPKDHKNQIEKLLDNSKKLGNILDSCVTVTSLDENHFCRKYLNSRKIPIQQQSRLWFSPDFRITVKEFTDSVDSKTIQVEPRLIIPFINSGQISVIQGRSFQENASLRYITLRSNDEAKKIFGLDRVDRTKNVCVVEGPIDSLFIPNCIATADSNLLSADMGDILIPDRDIRNQVLMAQVEKFIDSGKKVVMLPHNLKGKDINDFIINGMTQNDVLKTIAGNVFQGLAAKMHYVKWKKT